MVLLERRRYGESTWGIKADFFGVDEYYHRTVPFLASRNNWHDIIWISAVAYCMNLLLHFMIAELSLNNNGAQFIKCFENELFVGKLKMACTWLAFGLLGFSVVVNVSGFITGAAAVFSAWFHLSSVAGMLIFYVLAASVVYI